MKELYAEELIEAIVNAYKTGNKVLVCGNGGLCAASEHFAAELMGKFAFDVHIPCIALTANTSLITALANDFGFEEIFAYQVRVLGKPDDVLIAMTTSASRNIIKAIEVGNEMKMTTVALCSKASPNLGAKQTWGFGEIDTARIQQEILSFLHFVAYNCKRRLK